MSSEFNQPGHTWKNDPLLLNRVTDAFGGNLPCGDDNDVACELGALSARKYIEGDHDTAYELYLLVCEVMKHSSPASKSEVIDFLERTAKHRVAIADQCYAGE